MDINPTTNGENTLPAVNVSARWKREREIENMQDELDTLQAALNYKRYVNRIRIEVGL